MPSLWRRYTRGTKVNQTMPLAAGIRLGPYEIVAPLGAGGMGEVYRARDPRLGRDIAIKLLPADVAQDGERLARFRREAHLLASLNHPHVAAVYGLEELDSKLLLVLELVEGEDLAERLKRGAIPVDEALGIARQVAEALEEAHEHGIVHRDLKPANIKLTPEGKAKVLDFGLAKAYAGDNAAGSSDVSHSPTMTRAGSESGVLLGTAAYMSPEQARGKPVDKRADIWAFGVVLYEMLTGKRLFHGETTSDTLAAVLRQDLDWTRLPPDTPQSLRVLLQRCLERDLRQRLHDIADARIEMEKPVAIAGPSPPAGPVHTRRLVPLVGGLLLIASALGYLAGWRASTARPGSGVSFQRVTSRRGYALNPRFAPDGQTAVFGAAWEGEPLQLFQGRRGGGELPLGIKGADVLSVSRSGELAILLPRIHGRNAYHRLGSLARVPITGGAPRELAEGVLVADWAPDSQSLAVVRDVAGVRRLEFPLGKMLYETPHWIECLRVSPRGDRVAFFEGPGYGYGSFSLASMDRFGRRQLLSGGWFDIGDLAWSASGDEVWFGASTGGSAGSLYAVDLKGRQRALLQVPGILALHDVSPDGRALVSRVSLTYNLMIRRRNSPAEHRLSGPAFHLVDLSADGARLLERDSSGDRLVVSLRGVDGTPPVPLGDGYPLNLSADGRWAIAFQLSEQRLLAYPTGAGEARVIATDLEDARAARLLADGRRVLVWARTRDARVGFFEASLDGGPARPVTQPLPFSSIRMTQPLPLSPDNRFVAVVDADYKAMLVALDGGEVRSLQGIEANEWPVQWTPDGRQLYVYRSGEIPARVFKVDVATGARQLWREIAPTDSAGVSGIGAFRVTPDGSAYAYSYEQLLSELYLAEGLK